MLKFEASVLAPSGRHASIPRNCWIIASHHSSWMEVNFNLLTQFGIRRKLMIWRFTRNNSEPKQNQKSESFEVLFDAKTCSKYYAIRFPMTSRLLLFNSAKKLEAFSESFTTATGALLSRPLNRHDQLEMEIIFIRILLLLSNVFYSPLLRASLIWIHAQ